MKPGKLALRARNGPGFKLALRARTDQRGATRALLAALLASGTIALVSHMGRDQRSDLVEE